MGNFDWTIWGTKLLKKIAFGIVIGGLAQVAAYLGTEPVPVNYVWITVFAVEGIEILLNALKHGCLE